jgi:hypothetical protein
VFFCRSKPFTKKLHQLIDDVNSDKCFMQLRCNYVLKLNYNNICYSVKSKDILKNQHGYFPVCGRYLNLQNGLFNKNICHSSRGHLDLTLWPPWKAQVSQQLTCLWPSFLIYLKVNMNALLKYAVTYVFRNYFLNHWRILLGLQCASYSYSTMVNL